MEMRRKQYLLKPCRVGKISFVEQRQRPLVDAVIHRQPLLYRSVDVAALYSQQD